MFHLLLGRQLDMDVVALDSNRVDLDPRCDSPLKHAPDSSENVFLCSGQGDLRDTLLITEDAA